jgi:peptidoglycan/xylan/chitin deacetylase (PgdA/CDA1 family)
LSSPFLFVILLFILPPISMSESADKSQKQGSRELSIDLIVDGMSEDEENQGRVIRINANYDENNRNKEGNPLADFQPDKIAGPRIKSDDPNLLDGSLSISGYGRGKWSLTFPENVKIWRRSDDTSYMELISSKSWDKVELPLSYDLKIEGIKGSKVTNDVSIIAEFLPERLKKILGDSVLLTVLETQFVLTLDDGPLPEKTEKIVRALMRFYCNGEPVRAAFFQVGFKIHKFPELTRFVDQNGHLIFNRAISLERRSRDWWNAQRIEKVILEWEEEIYQALGRKPERIIRARYLKEGGRFERELQKAGVRVCGGELTFDFRSPSVEMVKIKTEEILQAWNTKENPQLHPCPAILIFHEHPRWTYDHIGEIVSYLQDRGFLLVHFDLEHAY